MPLNRKNEYVLIGVSQIILCDYFEGLDRMTSRHGVP